MAQRELPSKNKLVDGMSETARSESLYSFAIGIYEVKSTTENRLSWQAQGFGEKVDLSIAW